MDFTYLKNFMDKLTNWIIPGNTIVVYKDNYKVFEYSSGYADVENEIKMQGDEFFNIYSCSKPATVVAALKLYEQGKFLMSDPLYEYIPEFKDMYIKENEDLKKAKNPITIQNLFTMTAGFSYDYSMSAFDKAKKLTDGKMDTDIVIKCIAEEPLLFEPGTRWGYSFCHDVLAGLCECISGKRFSEYVTENIFIPLGMYKSFYHINADIEAKMAEQYCYDVNESDIVKLQKGGVRKQGVVKNVGKKCRHMIGENYDSGGSGVITTVDDYSKFAAMLANGGTGLNGEKILSSGTVDLMKTNQLSKELLQDIRWPQLKGYGYGLGVRTMIDKVAGGSNGSIGEFGWGGAAGATILCDTDINLAVFYAHHMLNPQEEYYQPRLRNIVYSCL